MTNKNLVVIDKLGLTYQKCYSSNEPNGTYFLIIIVTSLLFKEIDVVFDDVTWSWQERSSYTQPTSEFTRYILLLDEQL